MWDKAKIQNLLERSDKAVVRALMVLHNRQTESERQSYDAEERNQRGFSKFDAPLLSDLAATVKDGKSLTRKQMDFARRCVSKYWRQLVEEANGGSEQ